MSKIATIIDILCCLNNRLGLANIVKDKVVPIKKEFATVRNITGIIY